MPRYFVSNIEWDTEVDGVIEEVSLETSVTFDLDLPEEYLSDDPLDVSDDEVEAVTDALSDGFGWCVFGCEIERL